MQRSALALTLLSIVVLTLIGGLLSGCDSSANEVGSGGASMPNIPAQDVGSHGANVTGTTGANVPSSTAQDVGSKGA
jgi:hypothetical protein